MKSLNMTASFSVIIILSVCSSASANQSSANNARAAVMDVNDIANNATGKRKIAVEAMKERVAKIKKAQICPILTDTELEALIVVSTDSDVLWKRCSAKSSEASTLGRYTNMSVMKDCEKQAQRVLFFWDNHSYERAKKRYSD